MDPLIVAFTGHRPDKLGGYGPSPLQEWVRLRIRSKLETLRPSGVISGMALGVDTWAAEEAFLLGIPFVAAVPFKGQEARWPPESQARYRDLLARTFRTVYVSEPPYSVAKMQIRNQWMVDHCGKLIAVWDGSSGGTGNCVHYAERTLGASNIIRINPQEFATC
jgi:uncharacterized phage-like protein YoqJ